MTLLEGRRILLTGAGGFIGSRLAATLVRRGAKLTAFVRYNSRADIGLLSNLPADILNKIEIIFGDIRDADAIEQAMGIRQTAHNANGSENTSSPSELVFHLGALISIPYSYLHPVETVETNILGTLNILQACRKSGARVVHTSTSEVYGTALRVPIDESHPLQGQSPYSASKIGADKLVESYHRSYGLDTVTVRPFNTYGPGQSARAVIPTIITQALTREQLYLGSLETRRDFTFVDDTVAGFICAAEVLLDPLRSASISGEEINLGTGKEITIAEIAHLILQLIGKPDLPIHVDSKRLRPEKSEVIRLLSDNRKALHLLGWSPRVDIDSGLKQTINWTKENLEMYRPDIYER